MYIRITSASGGAEASVCEPLEFGSFSVHIDPEIDSDEVSRLDGIVRLESDSQAWVSSTWLLAQEPFASDEVARVGATGMLSYARDKGWIDEERNEIAAHVVRRDGGVR